MQTTSPERIGELQAQETAAASLELDLGANVLQILGHRQLQVLLEEHDQGRHAAI